MEGKACMRKREKIRERKVREKYGKGTDKKRHCRNREIFTRKERKRPQTRESIVVEKNTGKVRKEHREEKALL